MSTLLQPDIDVLVIGAGPAGTSTALHLVQINPNWQDRITIVDKATFPRDKLCGGGITRAGDEIISGLTLTLRLEHVAVQKLRLVFQKHIFTLSDSPVFRVVRREYFDNWLVQEAMARGITVRQNVAVTDVARHADHVEVLTTKGAIRARMIVVADGSRSTVKRRLQWGNDGSIARLLEVLTPATATQAEFQDGVATIDFSAVLDGLQGYYWDFPSLVRGVPVMNRGVFDSRVHKGRPQVSLKQVLRQSLTDRHHDLEDYQIHGHPIHWLNRHTRLAEPRIILVGDAAGVDPFLGEGIAFALAYGRVAAGAIADSFERADWSYSSYKRRVLQDPMLAQLPARAALARLIYGLRRPWQLSLLWRLAPTLVQTMTRLHPNAFPAKQPLRPERG